MADDQTTYEFIPCGWLVHFRAEEGDEWESMVSAREHKTESGEWSERLYRRVPA